MTKVSVVRLPQRNIYWAMNNWYEDGPMVREFNYLVNRIFLTMAAGE